MAIALEAREPAFRSPLRARTGGFAWLALACALAAAAWSWINPLYITPPRAGLVGGILVIGVAAACVMGARGSWRSGIGLTLALLVVTGCLDELLIRWEVRADSRVPAFSWFAALFGAGAVQTGCDGGDLLVQSNEGTFVFAPTFGAIGVRPVLLFWSACALVMQATAYRASRSGWLVLILAPLFAFGCRYGAAVMQFVGTEGVMAEQAHSPLAGFWSPWTILVALSGSALLWASTVRAYSVCGLWGGARRAALFGLTGIFLGAAWVAEDPGTPKRGRVLIDDRLSGGWEPAGRLLTKDRFGDFSTYSFASLTEHLSRSFSVTVNRERTYDSEYLSAFDVLILKNVKEPLRPEERKAILAWVKQGGGLFAISDHTDLSGMSTNLNPLTAEAGMSFRFDSVKPSAGGDERWSEPLVPEHPISAGLETFSLMTGCSIQLSGKARPVLTLRRATSMRGDYSGSSNFGAVTPSPADSQGGQVVAACGSLGKGRVLTFSDSTVLSSFCYYRDGHDRLVARGVAWLNHANRSVCWFRLFALGAGLAALLSGLSRRPQSSRLEALAHGAPWIAVSLGLGTWAMGTVLGRGLRVPEAEVRPVLVEFVTFAGHSKLPPVLGSAAELPRGVDLSTFVQIPQRLGHETRVSSEVPGSLSDVDTLVLLNPCDRTERELEEVGTRVMSWVEAGGSLVLARPSGPHGHRDEASETRGPLDGTVYGLGVAGTRPLTPYGEARARAGVSWRGFRCGAGHVFEVRGTEQLDTEGLGHCMALPTSRQRARYELSYELFEAAATRAVSRKTYFP